MMIGTSLLGGIPHARKGSLRTVCEGIVRSLPCIAVRLYTIQPLRATERISVGKTGCLRRRRTGLPSPAPLFQIHTPILAHPLHLPTTASPLMPRFLLVCEEPVALCTARVRGAPSTRVSSRIPGGARSRGSVRGSVLSEREAQAATEARGARARGRAGRCGDVVYLSDIDLLHLEVIEDIVRVSNATSSPVLLALTSISVTR